MKKDYEKQMEELGATLTANNSNTPLRETYIKAIKEISNKTKESFKLIPYVLKEDIEKLCPDIDFEKLK